MDVSLLGSILAPCLGFLLAGVNAAAAEIGANAGRDVLEAGKRLWAKLWPHIETRPAALEAARDVAESPDDQDALSALEWQLKKLLREQPGLEAELAPILADAVTSGVVAGGARSVAVGGSVTGSVIMTGDSGVVQR
jgi:hypothetical protein